MKRLFALAVLAPTAGLAHPGHSAGTTWFFHDGQLIGVLLLAAALYLAPEVIRAWRSSDDEE
ncbi:hypothetical protein FGG78_07095 [Thioclava sp. BHET1]|nr:hypothetical protein FGG78_07095 [Thioclava sp. BHET1]